MPELDALDVSWNEVGIASVADSRCGERLRSLEIGGFYSRAMPTDDFAALSRLPQLERFTLQGRYDLPPAAAPHLTSSPRLRALELSGAYALGDRALEAWAAGCPQLEELVLAGPQGITDAGLRALSVLPGLRRLELRGYDYSGGPQRVTDDGLTQLAANLRLSVLKIEDAPSLTGSSLAAFSGLRELTLGSGSDAGLEAIGRLTSLRRLKVEGPFTAPALAALERLSALECLELRCRREVPFAPDAFSFAGALRSLSELRLDGPIGDGLLQHLRLLPRLRRLSILSDTLTDAGLRGLSELPLRELFLRVGPAVTAEGLVRALADSSTLRHLELAGPARAGWEQVAERLPHVTFE